MADFNNFSIDITQLGFKLEPGVEYKFQINDGFCKDEYETTNLDLNVLQFTTEPVVITGQVSEYKANVMNITLSFSRNVLYNEGVVRLYHEDSTLVQTWDSTVLSTVDGSDSLVLSILDPLNALDRFTNYYVELEDNNFISEDRVLTKTNSWNSGALSFTFNTGDHDILPYSALVASAGSFACQLTYNTGKFTSNQTSVATQYSNVGYLLEDSAALSTSSNVTCFLSPANTLPHFLYYNHTYDQTNDQIVFDAANTSPQNIDVLDHITGLSGYIYTLTITPLNPSFVTTISSISTLGTTSFDNTSKVFTITGTDVDVSDNLDKLQITFSGLEGTFFLVYDITNNINAESETKTIKIYNVVYPTFTSFEFFGGSVYAGARNTPRSKTELYSAYDSNVYPWINDGWFLDVDSGIYQWRVPETGTYIVWAKGGGNSGALMKSNFYLEKDEEIEILCGLVGSSRTTTGNIGYAGSGGTFVVKKKYNVGTWGIKQQTQPTTNEILVIAGGEGSGLTSTKWASTSEIPNPGYISQTFYGTTSTSSGTITYSRTLQDGITYNGTAEGGAGFINDSGTADSYLNGGLGGRLQYNTGYVDGGFGSGGAAIGKLQTSSTTVYAGGGGGYAGGGAAIYIGDTISPAYCDGGGGSSYSNAYNIGGNTDLRWTPYNTNDTQYPHPFTNLDTNGDNGFVAIIKQ